MWISISASSMLIRKAFKFRLYPDRCQQQALDVQFGNASFVYNNVLAVRREHYVQTGAALSYADTTGQPAVLKCHPDLLWLQEADSQVLQQKLKDLDRAYLNSFEVRGRYTAFDLATTSSRSVIRSGSRWIWQQDAATYPG